MNHPDFRVPDRIFWILAGLIIGLTWGMLWYVYPLWPAALPDQLDLAGRVTAGYPKSFGLVFFPAIVQAVLTLVLAWFWRHPQHARWPRGRAGQGVSDSARAAVDRFIRHSLVMTVVLIDLIFAHLALLIVDRNLGRSVNLPMWSIIGLSALLLTMNIIYAVWISRLSRSGQAADGTRG